MRLVPGAVAKVLAGVIAPTVLTPTAESTSRSADQSPPDPGSVFAAAEGTGRPAAGAPTVPSSGPELPAAATTAQPNNVALSEAIAVGSSGPPPPPKLMLMTFAIGLGCRSTVCGETASSIPMMITEEKHPPSGQVTAPCVSSWMTAPTSAAVESVSLQTL